MTAAALRTFDRAFGELARQANVSIIAEGRPFRSSLDEAATNDLIHRLASASAALKAVPLSRAIQEIAAAYDYRVDHDGDGDSSAGGVFVLRKRYTDPNDFPDVPLDEAIYALRSIDRGFAALNLEPSGNDPLGIPVRLMLSLTAEQRKVAAADGDGVPLSTVDPNLRREAIGWSVAQNLGFPFDTAAKTANQLRITRNRRSVYRYMNLMGTGVTVFGLEGPFGVNAILLQFGLSHQIRPQLLNGSNEIFSPDRTHSVVTSCLTAVPANDSLATWSSINKEATEYNRKLIQAVEVNGTLADPDAPTPQDDAAAKADVPPTACTTLAQAVRSLNATAPPGASGTQKGGDTRLAKVDPVLGDKAVCVFNMRWLSERQALQSMADAYGERVVEQEDGSLLLTLRATPVVRSYEDLPGMLRTLFPLPWTEYYLGLTHRAEGRVTQQIAADPTLQVRPGMSEDDSFRVRAAMPQIAWHAQRTEEGAGYAAVVHRLRVVVEPQLASAPDGRLPMAAAGAEADRLLALLYVYDNLNQYHSLMEMSRDDRAKARFLDVSGRKEWYVHGTIDYPRKSVRLTLSSSDDSGRQRGEVTGIFGSDAIKESPPPTSP